MIEPTVRLPIDQPPLPGLVRVRDDQQEGVAEYAFCVGVTPSHARALTAEARVINHRRDVSA